MNKSPSTPSEATSMSLDDTNAFDDEVTIELTEIVDDDIETTTADSPEKRRRELEDEVLEIGGEIKESRNIENYTLAKVDISNELYVSIRAMKGEKINKAIAAMREGIHMILKGKQPGFWILGGNYANCINEEAGIILCDKIGHADEFFNLSKEMEREFSNNDKGETS